MKKSLLATCIALSCVATHAYAYEAGDMILRVGAANVNPSGDGALDGALDVEDDTQLGINFSYLFTDTLGIGILGATPFEHDITVNGDKATRRQPPNICHRRSRPSTTSTPAPPFSRTSVSA